MRSRKLYVMVTEEVAISTYLASNLRGFTTLIKPDYMVGLMTWVTNFLFLTQEKRGAVVTGGMWQGRGGVPIRDTHNDTCHFSMCIDALKPIVHDMVTTVMTHMVDHS